MIKYNNGYQCETCRTIYDTEEKALSCESKLLEQPIINIGFEFIEDYYYGSGEDEYVKIPTRIVEIKYEKHNIIYLFEQKLEDEYERSGMAFGNDDLLNMMSR